MSNINNRRILNRLHADAFLLVFDSYSSLINGLKSFLIGVLKFRHRLQIIGRLLFLLLSGTITLKTIFKYFKFYLSKVRKYIYPFNEKPSWRLLKKDRIFTFYFNWCHWYFTNQSHSMAQVLYAQEPRDPE